MISLNRLEILEVDWTDIGDHEKYINEVNKFSQFDFGKLDEFIYFGDENVVKYFKNEKVADDRYKNSLLNPSIFPNGIARKGQFYGYDFVLGQTLYKENSTEIFKQLLEWLSFEVWHAVPVEKHKFENACKKFYIDKTESRLNQYKRKYKEHELLIINDSKVRTSDDLISHIDVHLLLQGEARFIHGDLQFDNIIYNKDSKQFTLIDWRQDFAGHVDFGDLYYDLAKLYGGILLNYDLVKLNLMKYSESNEQISFDFCQRYSVDSMITTLESFILNRGYNLKKVRILVGLIFLNMSPLHHYPFDKLLHAKGRLILNNQVS